MGAPASNGKLCTKLSDMSIGDYIKCEYVAPTANVVGDFKKLGVESALSELPTIPSTTANGFFYFIKAEKGLLIADRMVQQQISAQTINNKGYLLGVKTDLGLIRCLSRAEFLKYISEGDLNGNMTRQDVDVWHGTTGNPTVYYGNWTGLFEINQNRIKSLVCTSFYIGGYTLTSSAHAQGTNGYGNNQPYYPIYQPYETVSTGYNLTYATGTCIRCFRPAIEYVDNSKSTNIWK